MYVMYTCVRNPVYVLIMMASIISSSVCSSRDVAVEVRHKCTQRMEM